MGIHSSTVSYKRDFIAIFFSQTKGNVPLATTMQRDIYEMLRNDKTKSGTDLVWTHTITVVEQEKYEMAVFKLSNILINSVLIQY